MKIPNGPSGFPTVSATQLRTYGTGGFRLVEQEEAKGCPRKYKAKYVERRVMAEERSYPLEYGSFFHDVLFRMEQHGETPQQALEAAFPVDGEPEMWQEAQRDLDSYMERGASPMDRYGTVAVEVELDAELYVDEEFGPIHYRGFVDWLGIDFDHPQVLHVVDYKTNRTPPRTEDVAGDVQMQGYDWLARANADRWGTSQVVVHLDCVKWREIEVRYSEAQIESWHSWCVAVVRKILRDEDAKPIVNPGCDYCPVKSDCPAFLSLPVVGSNLASALEGMEDPLERLRWRDAANGVRLLLDKSVKSIDADFKKQALDLGELVVGNTRWSLAPDWKTEIDLRSLHAAMGDAFYDIASVSKGAVESATATWGTDRVAAVKACVQNVPDGTKVVKGAVEA